MRIIDGGAIRGRAACVESCLPYLHSLALSSEFRISLLCATKLHTILGGKLAW